ncbi:MAG: DUF3253 domain-containing protein [Pseudomonadota bacterium]|nr:DUF3253 domain-containing protein [Pseudomonadota bacterium]
MGAADYRTRILELLQARGPDKTICPSELLSGEDKQNPALMEQVRASARTLVSQDLIEFTQRGKVVDPAAARGPIRLRLKR